MIILTVVTFCAFSDSLGVDAELVESVSTSEMDSGKTQLVSTLVALFLLKVDCSGFHLDGLLLVVDNHVSDLLDFRLFLLNRITLGLKF